MVCRFPIQLCRLPVSKPSRFHDHTFGFRLRGIEPPGTFEVGVYDNPREIHNTPNLARPTIIGLNEHLGFFGPNFRVAVPELTASSVLLIAMGGLLLCGQCSTRSRWGRRQVPC
jgi:hypothetical protein